MKEYTKPTCDEIELRQEENVAASCTNCTTNWVGNNDANPYWIPQGCYKTQGS